MVYEENPLKIGKLLETGYDNVKVGYSRKTDVYESPAQKAKRSNEFKADYFFSFHRNAANGNAQGFETEHHSSALGSVMELFNMARNQK